MNTGSERGNDYQLAELLCFAIYSANLAFGKLYRPILGQLGLTYTQYVTLVALWEEDHQTVSSLGAKLFLDSNTLTPTLKRLESMGYVERLRDPHDERQLRIQVTQDGRLLHEKATEAVSNLDRTVGLNPDDLYRMRRKAIMLRGNLLEHAR